MAYDEHLATRIRDLIGPDPELTEKKMFGGLAFLIRGHMAISASGQGGVLVHVDPGQSDDLVATTVATTAVMQGREMQGWLRVSQENLASDDDLSRWVEIGIGHARSLPPKQPASMKPKKLQGRIVAGPTPSAGPQDGTEPIGRKVDVTVAHISRVYDYWLGGKDNFAVDRIAAERVIAAYPDIVRSARGNRAFLGRVVRYLVREAGVRQFLDIGTGLPAADNTHEVAQSEAPECRVVYVDNDPVVLSHAKALLASGPDGATAYVDADLRDPATILAAAAEVLDFSRPVAVMLVAILQHIGDQDDPYGIVARLVAEMPSGSYLALSHPARDIHAAAMAEIANRMNKLVAEKVTFRTQAEVLRFFDGLELVEPGVVPVPRWRPVVHLDAASPTVMWGGVGRKS